MTSNEDTTQQNANVTLLATFIGLPLSLFLILVGMFKTGDVYDIMLGSFAFLIMVLLIGSHRDPDNQ